MGLGPSRPALPAETLNDLLEQTNFNKSQIQQLYARFCDLDKDGDGFVTKEELLNIKEIMTNPLGTQIIETFIREANTLNKIGDEEINMNIVRFPEFCAMLGSFNRSKGMNIMEEDKEKMESQDHSRFCKLRFLFDMYDNDGDDRITEVEMLKMLCKMATDPVTQHQRVSEEELMPYSWATSEFRAQFQAQRALAEMCPDKEPEKRTISFAEFKKSMSGINLEDKMTIKF